MRWVPALLLFSTCGAQPLATFRSEARLVEIHATVLDRRDVYVGNLTRDQFTVMESGQPVSIDMFEAQGSRVSIALILDVTGSMRDDLPKVKNAVRQFIEQLRPEDEVAVYGFNQTIERLQDFTTDKRAAIMAARRTRAEGTTALFDALAAVSRDVSRRRGKKAIFAFTDGQDNASHLTMVAAVAGAKRSGIPIYMAAAGSALKDSKFADALKEISGRSGAKYFEARGTEDMEKAFVEISRDLHNTYMLAYKPHSIGKGEWRTLAVHVKGLKNSKIRAREGYFAE